MRAGSLDRTITIQSRGPDTIDEGGAATPTWPPLAVLRAQLVQSSTEEYLTGAGERGKSAIIFRTRYVPAVTTASRILYDGRQFDIREVKELGRRRGLELRAEATEA